MRGGAAFTLAVTGTGFVASSKVRWNGGICRRFLEATLLNASVPASLIVAQGTAQVTVFTPTPGGVSTSQGFTITGGVPAVATVSAASFLGAELAPESIVAAFGSNLATGIAVASSVPLPTTLLKHKSGCQTSAGTSRDSACSLSRRARSITRFRLGQPLASQRLQ